MNAYLMK